MCIYINKNVVIDNFEKITKLYNKVPMIFLKSNAYGLGIENILPLLMNTPCETIFVKNIKEGLKARNISKTMKIIILDPIKITDKEVYLKNKITPVINDLEDLVKYKEVFSNVPCVLNIDIGMNRLGVSWSKVIENIHLIKSFPIIHIMGHLHITDEVPMNPINLLQKEKFHTAISYFSEKIQKSLAASHALAFGKEFIYDAPRIGRALYGLSHKNYNLKEALTFEFEIILVRFAKVGEIVGYNAYKVNSDVYLGILNVGYVNGLDIMYANNSYILCDNRKQKIISISMEYTIVEFINYIPKVGEKVILFPDGFVKENLKYSSLEKLVGFQNVQKIIR
jgi:alanine racemase